VLLHRDIGLDTFNHMPDRRAVYALFECCHCVTMAGDLLKGRPYLDREQLFRRADELVDDLSDQLIEVILQAHRRDAERDPEALRMEIARCNRRRLELMLGPEGGYDNWL
jgi:2-oxo-4-hydroxy-4-carboxy-5-ureidoimidazoline decarboxylase